MGKMTREDALEELKKLHRTESQKVMPDSKLHEIFESELDFARKGVASEGGLTLQFTIYGLKRGTTDEWNPTLCIMADWPPDDKEAAMRGLGAMYAKGQGKDYMPMAVAQVTEAWQGRPIPQNSIVPIGHHTPPSEQKDRTEVIVVSVIAMDQRQDFATEEIVRDDKGKFLSTKSLIEQRFKLGDNFDDMAHNYLVRDFYLGYFGAQK